MKIKVVPFVQLRSLDDHLGTWHGFKAIEYLLETEKAEGTHFRGTGNEASYRLGDTLIDNRYFEDRSRITGQRLTHAVILAGIPEQVDRLEKKIGEGQSDGLYNFLPPELAEELRTTRFPRGARIRVYDADVDLRKHDRVSNLLGALINSSTPASKPQYIKRTPISTPPA